MRYVVRKTATRKSASWSQICIVATDLSLISSPLIGYSITAQLFLSTAIDPSRVSLHLMDFEASSNCSYTKQTLRNLGDHGTLFHHNVTTIATGLTPRRDMRQNRSYFHAWIGRRQGPSSWEAESGTFLPPTLSLIDQLGVKKRRVQQMGRHRKQLNSPTRRHLFNFGSPCMKYSPICLRCRPSYFFDPRVSLGSFCPGVRCNTSHAFSSCCIV